MDPGRMKDKVDNNNNPWTEYRKAFTATLLEIPLVTCISPYSRNDYSAVRSIRGYLVHRLPFLQVI